MLIRILDAYSLGYAHHHATPVREHNGLQVQALMGFLEKVRKSLKQHPDALHLILWEGLVSWRKEIFPEYKSGRLKTAAQREMREHFEAQVPWMKKALAYFPVVQAQSHFAEADDLAWGFSRQFEKQGYYVQLLSADTDWLQMVSSRVEWVNARRPSQRVTPDNMLKETGFPDPQAVAWCKAIAGDVSDDIPGVADIANKRALELINKHGDLEAILRAHRTLLSEDKVPAYRKRLALPETVELVRRNEKLVVLPAGRAIVPEEVELTFGDFDTLGLYEVFHDLGITEWTGAFSAWERALDRALLSGEKNCVSRAVNNFASSWWSATSSS